MSKRKRLSELYDALLATRPFPGKEKVRLQVGQALGRAAALARR